MPRSSPTPILGSMNNPDTNYELDEDVKQRLERNIEEYRESCRRIDSETRERVGDRYYELLRVNYGYANLWLSGVLNRWWSKDSLLCTGFKMMISKAHTIHMLVTTGDYFVAFRELRFLLEFAKRAAYLDVEMNCKTLDDKIREYQLREDRAEFRGKQLLESLKEKLNLTEEEYKAIDDLFKELSPHAHGSECEIQRYSPEERMTRTFDNDLFDKAFKFTYSLTDIYLVLLKRCSFIGSEDLRIPRELSSYLPLSSRLFGITQDESEL